jgi:phosphate transport system substrate-binding protein
VAERCRAHILRLGLLALLVALAVACSRRAAADLTLAGSTSVQPFAEKWAEVYRTAHPSFEVLVQGGGSTAGVVAAETGAAQIGMCSRELKKDEAERVKPIEVARDAMVLVVHPTNPIADLTLDQIQRLYAGDVRAWTELGGAGRRLTLITREEGSGTRGAFEELVMKNRRIHASALVQDSMGAVRQMVSADPAAIGYISLGLVDATVKAVRIEGVEATEGNVDAGRYPLVRPFLFVVRGEPTPAAREFIAWVTSPEGRDLTRKQGLLPPRS